MATASTTETTSLELFAEFSSWDEFFRAVKIYSDKTFQPFVKVSSKKVVAHNKSHKQQLPEEMVFAYQTLGCTHRGDFQPRGKGHRETKSSKEGCKAKIHAALDKDDPMKIIVKSLVNKHNHEIGQHLYKRYAQNRALTESERMDAEKLCSLNVPNKNLRKELQAVTGKSVTLQDVVNVKTAYRRKEKQAISGDQSLNAAQLLMKKLDNRRKEDPGLVTHTGMGNNGELQYLFVQTSQMKEVFSKFSEHLLLDATYCVNDCLMPLISFIAVDGFNRSHLIAFAIVANETAYMYDQIFSVFKDVNSLSASVKTFMVDKDFVAISALQNHFPQAHVELCLFHVKKTFKKHILLCPKGIQVEMMELLERMCAAECESDYEGVKERLLVLDQNFSHYFIRNWDSMRDRWVKYARDVHVNFGDTTNNRIESYHQKLKSIISSPLPLDQFFDAIMFYYDTASSEHAHSEFSALVKRSRSMFPSLQKDITGFALRKVECECKRSVEWSVSEVESGYLVSKGDTIVSPSVDKCTCAFFLTMIGLPCRHMFALRKFLNIQPLLSKDMFHKRWHLNYNCLSTSLDNGREVVTTFDWETAALSKRDKYAIGKAKLDKLLSKLVELGSDQFLFFIQKLDEFDSLVGNLTHFVFTIDTGFADIGPHHVEVDVPSTSDVDVPGQVEVEVVPSDLVHVTSDVDVAGQVEVEVVPSDLVHVTSDVDVAGQVEVEVVPSDLVHVTSDVDVAGQVEVEVVPSDLVHVTSDVAGQMEVVPSDLVTSHVRVTGQVEVVEAATSRSDILQNLKPPLRVPKRGRPKDFGITVIGLPKRSRILKDKCNRCRKADPDKSLSCGETAWVQCDGCTRWFHAVCVKFSNGAFKCWFCQRS